MRVVFYSFNEDDALAVIRMTGPAKMAGIEVIHGVHDRTVNVEAVKEGEIIILHREFAVDYENYEKVIQLARSLKKPVILDLDDLIISLPEDHPDRLAGNFAPALLPLLQSIIEADLVTVPTQSLRANLLPYNPAIEVLPNYLDDSLWQIKPPTTRESRDEALVIGYMGGHSHTPDLELVLPALVALIEKYPNRIRLQFWGIQPPKKLIPFSRVGWLPAPSRRYSDFVAYFEQQKLDIAIAPLCDNRFNACKSAIKFLDYSAIGAAGVYSRVTPYAEIIEDGAEGLLASTTEEWLGALSRLIESPELRSSLVERAQSKIRKSWLLSDHVEGRREIYRRLAAKYRQEDKEYPYFFQLQKSITRQMYEQHVRNYRRLSGMGQQLEELEAEVVSYATSNSWKITRPLRKILKIW
jgi:glycosyltransferase involved in cell wall biosynthesis